MSKIFTACIYTLLIFYIGFQYHLLSIADRTYKNQEITIQQLLSDFDLLIIKHKNLKEICSFKKEKLYIKNKEIK